MSSFYGLDSGSSFMDTFFGTSNSYSSYGSSGNSLVSSLGDLNMIKSGVYKKALKAYYKTQSDNKDSSTESISGSGAADSKISLSNLKTASKKLYESANKLKSADYSGNTEDMLKTVKGFVDDYNSMISSTKNMNSYSILQTTIWGMEQMKASEGLLNKIGITIGADNTLSIDEDKFKEAKMSDLKGLFSGSGSLADRIAQKASTLFNQSTNQLAINEGKFSYNMYGSLI